MDAHFVSASEPQTWNLLMDEETEKYLDGMMVQINDKFERVLGEISTRRADFMNTKGVLLKGAILAGRRSLPIEQRLSQLERKSP